MSDKTNSQDLTPTQRITRSITGWKRDVFLNAIENKEKNQCKAIEVLFGGSEKIEGDFDIILANPPFKGVIDASAVDPTLSGKVKTKKTELLFLVLMLRMLKTGGRCAVIVPDGVLFGASKAHVALRKMLVEENQLEGVVSLPSGVFKPYAGVSTAILFFTKGGQTENVWFYDLEDDGYSLDDKRTQLYDDTFAGNLPKCLQAWNEKNEEKDTDRSKKAFFVSAEELVKNKYDLSINRYKDIAYEEEDYDEPIIIMGRIKNLDSQIMTEIESLEKIVK